MYVGDSTEDPRVKEIKAIIQPGRLARVREAVRRIPDFPGMTVTRAEGSGYHPGKPHEAGIKGELAEYSPKVRIELVVADKAGVVKATRQVPAGDFARLHYRMLKPEQHPG